MLLQFSVDRDYITRASTMLANILERLTTNADDEYPLSTRAARAFMEEAKSLQSRVEAEVEQYKATSRLTSFLSWTIPGKSLYQDAELLGNSVEFAINNAKLDSKLGARSNNSEQDSSPREGNAFDAMHPERTETNQQYTSDCTLPAGEHEMPHSDAVGDASNSSYVTHAASIHGPASIGRPTHLGISPETRSEQASPMMNIYRQIPESKQVITPSIRIEDTENASATTPRYTIDSYDDASSRLSRSQSVLDTVLSVSRTTSEDQRLHTAKGAMTRDHSIDLANNSVGHHEYSRGPASPPPNTRLTRLKTIKVEEASGDLERDSPEQCKSSSRRVPPPPPIATAWSTQLRTSPSHRAGNAQTYASPEYVSPHSAATHISREPSYDRARPCSRSNMQSSHRARPSRMESAENIQKTSSQSSYSSFPFGTGTPYIYSNNSTIEGMTVMNGGHGNSGSVINKMMYPRGKSSKTSRPPSRSISRSSSMTPNAI